MAENPNHSKLGVISFGLALGVTWGLSLAFLAVMAAAFKWGAAAALILANLYIGYGPNFIGAMSGAVWGFTNGFVFGVLIAWLYNKFLLVRQGNPVTHSRNDSDGKMTDQ